MTRKATPTDLLDVSQETPVSNLLVDIFGEEPAVPVFNYHDVSEMVPLDMIEDNPYQPRVRYNGIDELAENIRQNGLLQPPAGRNGLPRSAPRSPLSAACRQLRLRTSPGPATAKKPTGRTAGTTWTPVSGPCSQRTLAPSCLRTSISPE